MAVSVLKEIRATEYEAERLEKTSVSDAKEILSDTRKEAYEHLEQSIQDAETKARDIIIHARKQAEIEISKLDADVDKDCEVIKQQAEVNLQKAVDFIMGRIVKTSGNS